jgi:hypothetical protein
LFLSDGIEGELGQPCGREEPRMLCGLPKGRRGDAWKREARNWAKRNGHRGMMAGCFQTTKLPTWTTLYSTAIAELISA